MFNLNKTERVSMGLRKMTADYISMSKDHEGYEDKATKFRYNTSSLPTGGREYVEKAIIAKLRVQKNLNSDHNEIFSKLLAKVEDASDDFNLEKMEKVTDISKYVFQNLNWLFDTILTELKHKKGDDYHETFVSESDRAGDTTGSIKTTTEDEMLKQGIMLTEEKDLDFDDREATKNLVKTLDLLKVCQDTLLQTDNNHINVLKLLQAAQAHGEFVETELYLKDKYGENEVDSQIIKAHKKTDLIASLGFEYNANIKQVAKKRLAEDYITSDQRLLNAYRSLLKSCEHLEIPILELDAETIMDDEYIRQLRIALNQKQTVCVSEYDIAEFDVSVNSIDLKKKYIRSELLKNEIPKRRIQFYFNKEVMDEIYKLKASEFRKLDSIVTEIRHSHNAYVENGKFANYKEGDKHVNDLMKESQEYKRRVKITKTTLLTGYGEYKTKKGYVPYKGVFSDESLELIKMSTDRYFNMLITRDPERITSLYRAVQKHIILNDEKELIADGNGFLKYAENGHYLELPGAEFGDKGPSTKKFIFNKWLVNEKGFIVSKFLDAEPKVREELKVHRTPNKDSFKGLIVKTIDGKEIFNGDKYFE